MTPSHRLSWGAEARAIGEQFLALQRNGLNAATDFPRSPWRLVVVTLALFAIFLDALTTWYLLNSSRGFYEANPFAAPLMELVGVGPYVCFVSVLCLCLPALAVARPRTRGEAWVVGFALAVLGGKLAVAVANTMLLASG